MEKARLLNSECVERLKSTISENLERYRSGNFVGLLDEITVDIEFDYSELNEISMPDGDDLKDVENCLVIERACINLTPFMARDERLWVQLTHGPLLEYSRKRWPIPEDAGKAISFIKSHFFASNKRNLEARNAVSRLYWLAYMATRVKGGSLRETLELVLHRQDVRQNVIERPTVLQVETILGAVINNLKRSRDNDAVLYGREDFRELQKRLNEYCGYIFVESLPQKDVQAIVDSMVSDIIEKRGGKGDK